MNAGSLNHSAVIAVSTSPGQIALTRIPERAYSIAAPRQPGDGMLRRNIGRHVRVCDHRAHVVVGDDPALEMRMANDAGAVSVGMTTGLMKRDTAAGLKPAEQPDVLLDTLEPLLRALR